MHEKNVVITLLFSIGYKVISAVEKFEIKAVYTLDDIVQLYTTLRAIVLCISQRNLTNEYSQDCNSTLLFWGAVSMDFFWELFV